MIVGPDGRMPLRMRTITDAMLTGLIDRATQSRDEVIADLQQQLVGKDMVIEKLAAALKLATGWGEDVEPPAEYVKIITRRP